MRLPYLPEIRLPRLYHWIVIALLCLAAIAILSPQQLPVVAYKVCMVALFAVLGYWIDRSLFPYARPNEFLQFNGIRRAAYAGQELVAAAAMTRRALIILAVVLAGALGL